MGIDRLGEVWDAWDDVEDASVIVRLLANLPDEEERVLVEDDIALAQARLSNTSVARVVAVDLSARQPFVVSPSTDRPYPIAQILQRGRRLTAAASFSIAAQIAAVLADAHAAGVSHGSLSSASVCLTSSGRVLVLDFGLLRLNRWTTTTPRPTRRPDDSSRQADDVREFMLMLLAMLIGPDAPATARVRGLTRQLRLRLRESAPRLSPEVLRLIDRALQPGPYGVPAAADVARALRRQRPQIPLRVPDRALPKDQPRRRNDPREASRQMLHVVTGFFSALVTTAKRSASALSSWGRRFLATVQSRRWTPRWPAWRPTAIIRRRALALAALVLVVVCGSLVTSLALVGHERGASSIPMRSQPPPSSIGVTHGSGSTSGAPTAMPSVTGVDSPTVRVPVLNGLTALAATKKLVRNHLRLSSVEPAVGPPGIVLRSVPAAGRPVAEGSRVRLVIGADAFRVRPSPSESP
jgi:hypothetical protein